MIDQLPRRSSTIILRNEVAAWLHGHADIAVRLVVAPPGFGKTTAIAAHTDTPSGRRRMYIPIDARTTCDALAAAFARALGERPADTGTDATFLLATAAPLEITLDDMHLAATGVLAMVNDLIADQTPGVFFIIASQRRDIFDIGSLFARGLIAVCDQSELTFKADDARALFAAYGVEAMPAAIDALVARAEGWPPAIVGTVRELRRAPQAIGAAYEHWRDRSSVPRLELVNALLERVPLAERAVVRRHFTEGSALDQHTLAVLHRYGFFVQFNAGTFALMHWIDELYPASRATHAERPLLAAQLFGRFTATIGGVRIVWARRRDAQIVKYLLLRPQASATRTELADVFWPGTARPLAKQNLRTACSTIRRAIGDVVGMQHVDTYFIAGERLILSRSAIVCDVDRFRRHVESADADDAAGKLNDAIAHLRAAERLYGNGLFAGDVGEPAFLDDTLELADLYARVIARLSSALIERGSSDLAREYAAKALKLGLFAHGSADRPQVHLRIAAS